MTAPCIYTHDYTPLYLAWEEAQAGCNEFRHSTTSTTGRANTWESFEQLWHTACFLDGDTLLGKFFALSEMGRNLLANDRVGPQEASQMNAIVIEHVPVAELPPAWRARLASISEARVTVRIEAEGDSAPAQGATEFADDPLFGMWRDREDMADVAGYIRAIRACG